MKIKKGDIVGRKSYGKDIFFIVDKILKISVDNELAILKGLNIRVVADSPKEDLEVITKDEFVESIRKLDVELEKRIEKNKIKNQMRQRIYTGKILHLDGELLYENVA